MRNLIIVACLLVAGCAGSPAGVNQASDPTFATPIKGLSGPGGGGVVEEAYCSSGQVHACAANGSACRCVDNDVAWKSMMPDRVRSTTGFGTRF